MAVDWAPQKLPMSRHQLCQLCSPALPKLKRFTSIKPIWKMGPVRIKPNGQKLSGKEIGLLHMLLFLSLLSKGMHGEGRYEWPDGRGYEGGARVGGTPGCCGLSPVDFIYWFKL